MDVLVKGTTVNIIYKNLCGIWSDRHFDAKRCKTELLCHRLTCLFDRDVKISNSKLKHTLIEKLQYIKSGITKTHFTLTNQ